MSCPSIEGSTPASKLEEREDMSPPAAWWKPRNSFGELRSTSQITRLATSCNIRMHEPNEQMKTANPSAVMRCVALQPSS